MIERFCYFREEEDSNRIESFLFLEIQNSVNLRFIFAISTFNRSRASERKKEHRRFNWELNLSCFLKYESNVFLRALSS